MILHFLQKHKIQPFSLFCLFAHFSSYLFCMNSFFTRFHVLLNCDLFLRKVSPQIFPEFALFPLATCELLSAKVTFRWLAVSSGCSFHTLQSPGGMLTVLPEAQTTPVRAAFHDAGFPVDFGKRYISVYIPLLFNSSFVWSYLQCSFLPNFP